MKSLTIGSTFSGIGLFELGLAMGLAKDGRFNPEILWQIEIDPFCHRVLNARFPDSVKHHDITQIKTENLQRPDIICGGWPCQDHSVAGKQKGLEGEKSGLFWHLFRIVRDLRPSIFVLENVPAVTNTGLDRCLAAFASIGAYDIEWVNLRASDFGAPHRRERIFFVGILADADNSDKHGISFDARPVPGASQFPHAADTQSIEDSRITESKAGIIERHGIGYSSNPWRSWTDEPPLRRVDDGSSAMLDRNKRLKALGNAVVPQCAEWIGEKILRII